jgi:hypothetical protein
VGVGAVGDDVAVAVAGTAVALGTPVGTPVGVRSTHSTNTVS